MCHVEIGLHGRNSSFMLHVAESNTLMIVFLSRQKRLSLYKGSTSLQYIFLTTKTNTKQPSTLLKLSTQSNLQRSQELRFRFPVEAKHTINQSNKYK